MKRLFTRLFGLGAATEVAPAASDGPQLFLGYELHRKVSQVGPATVYLGREPSTDRPVAIKLLEPTKRKDPDRVPRFEREAEIYAQLDHPNIVAFLAQGEQDGRRGIVLEWLAAPTLASRLEVGPRVFSPATAVALLRQLASALESAHARDVVHRDVSPKNLHLAEDATLKLTNFSVAKVVDARLNTRVGTHFGDFRYSSPEANKAQPTDATTDLYSAGLIFYELLTGRRALIGSGLVEVLGQQLREDFLEPSHLVPGLSPAVDRLVARLLAFDPARRLGSASVLLERLDGLAL